MYSDFFQLEQQSRDVHMPSAETTSSSDEEPEYAAGSSRETQRVSSFVVQYYTETITRVHIQCSNS